MDLRDGYLLLQRAQDGDMSAENTLFDLLSNRFNLFLRIRLSDVEAAREISQEACLTVFDKYKEETFADMDCFFKWAFTILLMKLGNHFKKVGRSNKRLVAMTADAFPPDRQTEIDDTGLRLRLVDCLKKIVKVNRRYGRILIMAYQGYTANEVCARLGLNRDILYVALNRGRNILKKCLETGGV